MSRPKKFYDNTAQRTAASRRSVLTKYQITTIQKKQRKTIKTRLQTLTVQHNATQRNTTQHNEKKKKEKKKPTNTKWKLFKRT
jgi:hypothetical protein